MKNMISIWLFYLTLGTSFTMDMRSQIEMFCSCWRFTLSCNLKSLFLDIDLTNCSEHFPWERRSFVTDFEVLVEYNHTTVRNKVTCYRQKDHHCSHPVIPFFSTEMVRYGVAIEVVPMCKGCRCRPVRKDDVRCLNNVQPPLPPTNQLEHYQFGDNDAPKKWGGFQIFLTILIIMLFIASSVFLMKIKQILCFKESRDISTTIYELSNIEVDRDVERRHPLVYDID